jgi:hypothetical protein
MIVETVVALLMFVQGEIKEARLQPSMSKCLRGKITAERQYSETVSYKCFKGSAELEDNIDGSKSIKKLILD